jgi:hypothetical protein
VRALSVLIQWPHPLRVSASVVQFPASGEPPARPYRISPPASPRARKQPRRQRPQPLKHACSPGKSREQDTKQRRADPTDDERCLLLDKANVARPNGRFQHDARRWAWRHDPGRRSRWRGGFFRRLLFVPQRTGNLDNDLTVGAPDAAIAIVHCVKALVHVIVHSIVFVGPASGTRRGSQMAQGGPACDKLRCGFEPRFLEPLGGAWVNAILFRRRKTWV